MSSPRQRSVSSTVSISLSIECRDEEVAMALDAALMPDNRYFPKDQSFTSRREGRMLAFRIASPRVRPALTTTSSLIFDARLFSEVWVMAKSEGLPAAASR